MSSEVIASDGENLSYFHLPTAPVFYILRQSDMIPESYAGNRLTARQFVIDPLKSPKYNDRNALVPICRIGAF